VRFKAEKCKHKPETSQIKPLEEAGKFFKIDLLPNEKNELKFKTEFKQRKLTKSLQCKSANVSEAPEGLFSSTFKHGKPQGHYG